MSELVGFGRLDPVNRSTPILGVALDGVGAHPAAPTLLAATPSVLGAGRLVELARTAERGGFDFVTLHDSFDPADPASGELVFRLDALLALAHVAAATTTVGVIATVTTTHTEPFHVSKNVATLDLVSHGRAGWRVAVSTSSVAAQRFGRKDPAPIDELVAEADEVVDVVSRLWDSWEDDAVIRDVPTGRYLDRDKVHHVDFEGRFFRVRGPSITPRPPQGQPIVVVDVRDDASLSLAGRRADLAVIDAGTTADAASTAARLRDAAVAAGRAAGDVKVLVHARIGAPDLRRRLDDLTRVADGSLDLVGEPDDVARTMADWAEAVDGFLLRPDALADTLDWVVDDVLPALRAGGLLADVPSGATLRDRIGLARPENRYAGTGAAT